MCKGKEDVSELTLNPRESTFLLGQDMETLD
jgi:hypothetical protein